MITLTIIGVIAALTVPNLMSNFRKREIETALPIAYKIIDDAMKLAVITNGHPSTWTYDGSIGFAEKYFIPYVKVGKNCGLGTGWFEYGTGCFKYSADYKNGYWYMLNNTIANFGGWDSRWYNTMILANGMHVGIRGDESQNQNQNSQLRFVIDVNGKKGPTKIGVDVFTFVFKPHQNKFVEWENDNDAACTLDKKGYNCTQTVQQNGWKFPDDYPIKKW